MATTSGIFVLPADFDDLFGGGRHGEIDRRTSTAASRPAESGTPSASRPRSARRLLPAADVGANRWRRRGKARDRRRPARSAVVPCVRRPREWQCEVAWRVESGSSGAVEQWHSMQVPLAVSHVLTVQLDRLDDFVEIVRHGHGAVGEGGAADAAAAEHFVELLLVGRMIGHGGRGVFQLVAGEDADDALVGPDDALGHQLLHAGHAGRAGRFAAQPAGAHLGLGVEDFLVGDFADHAVAPFQGAEHLVRFTGRLISMALAMVEARRFWASISS